jgi:hypothetical protein
MKYVPYMELRDRSSERAIGGAEIIVDALPDDFAIPHNQDAVRVADGDIILCGRRARGFANTFLRFPLVILFF